MGYDLVFVLDKPELAALVDALDVQKPQPAGFHLAGHCQSGQAGSPHPGLDLFFDGFGIAGSGNDIEAAGVAAQTFAEEFHRTDT